MKKYLLVFSLAMVLSVGITTEAYAQRKVTVSTLSIITDGQPYIVHEYHRRERIEDIAKAYDVTISDIDRANPDLKGKKLKHRTKILIPMGGFREQDSRDELFIEIDSSELIALQDTVEKEILFGKTAEIARGENLQVAVILPFEGNGNKKAFTEFYNGMLLALEELTLRGAEVDVNIISSDKSVLRAEDIISSGELDDANLIIGPVYGDEFRVIAQYAGENRVPIISPLAGVDSLYNPFVVDIAPSESTKWEDVGKIIRDSSVNVVVIDHQTLTDHKIFGELSPYISPMARRVSYRDKTTRITDISNALSTDIENVVVIPVSNEIAVEEILSRLSSMNAMGRYDIRVVGLNTWSRFNKLDLSLFYKLGVVYPSSYFYDHLNISVAPLHSRYISKFQNMPTLFSMRGYDVAMVGVGMLYNYGEDMMYKFLEYGDAPLQTIYNFEQLDGAKGKLSNTHWPVVEYSSDYTIDVR